MLSKESMVVCAFRTLFIKCLLPAFWFHILQSFSKLFGTRAAHSLQKWNRKRTRENQNRIADSNHFHQSAQIVHSLAFAKATMLHREATWQNAVEILQGRHWDGESNPGKCSTSNLEKATRLYPQTFSSNSPTKAPVESTAKPSPWTRKSKLGRSAFERQGHTSNPNPASWMTRFETKLCNTPIATAALPTHHSQNWQESKEPMFSNNATLDYTLANPDYQTQALEGLLRPGQLEFEHCQATKLVNSGQRPKQTKSFHNLRVAKWATVAGMGNTITSAASVDAHSHRLKTSLTDIKTLVSIISQNSQAVQVLLCSWKVWPSGWSWPYWLIAATSLSINSIPTSHKRLS